MLTMRRIRFGLFHVISIKVIGNFLENLFRLFVQQYVDNTTISHDPTSVADPDPDLWIRSCIIKVGSGSVWRDTNPDPDPGHIR